MSRERMRMQPKLAGCADSAFLRCSVDINATIARFLVLRFHSSQPDHA